MNKSLSAIAAAAALVLAGCGGGSSLSSAEGDDGSGTGKDGSSITVGLIPVAEFSPVYIAEDRGFFEDEGLDVKVEVMSNAASIVPSVLNGQLTFGTAATPPFLVAAEKGIPVKAVANAGNTADGAKNDTGAIVVAKSSDVQDLSDLEGRTVAVNALSSLPHVAVASLLKEKGVDPSKVKFVAMPFPDMLGALKQDRVDAIVPVEPFMTQALADDTRELAPIYAETYPAGTTHTLYFGSDKFIKANPDAVAGFQRAIAKANELVAKDPEVLRDALVKNGGMPEKVASAVKLPAYQTAFEVAGMQDMADKMVDTGFLKKKLDVSTFLVN